MIKDWQLEFLTDAVALSRIMQEGERDEELAKRIHRDAMRMIRYLKRQEDNSDVQPVAELVEHDVFNGVVKGFKTLTDLPVGTKFYLHPPATDVQELVTLLKIVLQMMDVRTSIQEDWHSLATSILAKWEGK